MGQIVPGQGRLSTVMFGQGWRSPFKLKLCPKRNEFLWLTCGAWQSLPTSI
jgi:hypothetical protein